MSLLGSIGSDVEYISSPRNGPFSRHYLALSILGSDTNIFHAWKALIERKPTNDGTLVTLHHFLVPNKLGKNRERAPDGVSEPNRTHQKPGMQVMLSQSLNLTAHSRRPSHKARANDHLLTLERRKVVGTELDID